MGFVKERQSTLLGLAKVHAVLAPNMQIYFYIIDGRNRFQMVKGTCLTTPQRKPRTH
jgi:hypothetical protein